jgi:two-component system chemotaxis response regulator CheY
MKSLIAEDDFVSRQILKEILSPLGDYDIVVDGDEAIAAFQMALRDKKPYDLVCLDIMMPKLDGNTALEQIREIEKKAGIVGSAETKIIMVTALDDPKTVFKSYYKGGATAYVVKPIEKEKLLKKIKDIGLL